MRKFLVVHGHFYQPPRENPWTETIERQPGAHPYHDWNERITHECYFPNGYSRILDATNRIVNIVNNYRSINFNFGPTLLGWLEVHSPEVYQRILQADRESAAYFSGHGSAIAQCYNHIIMPLANERDQHTQIIWGVADFRLRFKRDPEAIWLPETAINEKTLNILSQYPFKYIILSPFQALRVRSLKEDKAPWKNVEAGNIDTRQPYRCYVKDANGQSIKDRYMDIFFYNGEISRGISFEHLLRNAGHLADRIVQGFGQGKGDKILSVATDGETYGHHEQYGDMGLAYLFNVEVPLRHIEPINFAAYLATHPPEFEVELKSGPNGEGTAWSCSHGVSRWYRDCGCKTGGDYRWNQAWRTPLRQALDHLRDILVPVTEELGASLFKDVWQARDGYIQVILNRSRDSLNRFFHEYAVKPLSEEETRQAIKLMELQRQTQLMYTSCGWFFTEISGIETVQILKYAARAIQLAESLMPGFDYEASFIADLKKARSNIPEYQDGEWIYNHFVKPSVVEFDKVVNHFAICSMFDTFNGKKEDQGKQKIYIYGLEELAREIFATDEVKCWVGRVRVSSRITLEEEEFAYALINLADGEKLHCHVRSLKNDSWDFATAKADILQLIQKGDEIELHEKARKIWRGKIYTLADMFFDERQKVVDTLIQSQLSEISEAYENIYARYKGLNLTIAKLDVPLPEAIAVPAKMTLGRTLLHEVIRLENVTDVRAYRKAFEATRTADRLNISLDKEKARAIFQSNVENQLLKLYMTFGPENVRRVITLIEIADRLKLNLSQSRIQNQLFEILKFRVKPGIEKIVNGDTNKELYNVVNDTLRIAYHFNFNIKVYKDRLRPFEEKISQDPNYWP